VVAESCGSTSCQRLTEVLWLERWISRGCRLRRRYLQNAATALLLAVVPALWAAEFDQNAGHGKGALCVYNQTKLDKARSAEAVDPKRVVQPETWRRNDEDAMGYLRLPRFAVTPASESTPVQSAKSQDLVVISESVDAVDVDAKYRYLMQPMVLLENDLLGVLGMTAL